MNTDTHDERWVRLIDLLRPFHEQAQGTARRLCRSATDGDDLFQETVLRAFDKLHTLRDPSRFRSWFYATLLSRHRSRWRRSLWRRCLGMDEAFAAGEPAGEDGSAWDREARIASRAARALSTLPAEQCQAIVLFELDGHSIEEIAAMQGASVPAVKSRLVRGRERLRRFYERLGVNRESSGRESPPSGIEGHTQRSAGERSPEPSVSGPDRRAALAEKGAWS